MWKNRIETLVSKPRAFGEDDFPKAGMCFLQSMTVFFYFLQDFFSKTQPYFSVSSKTMLPMSTVVLPFFFIENSL